MSPAVRRPVLAANWKMNNGPTQARAFIASFVAAYTPRTDRTIVLFPPALSFTTVRDALGSRTDIVLGVQNVHTEAKGAFTGENSAPMAKDAGAAVALVGHSERRHVFGETDEATASKCAVSFDSGLVPMLCVGEKIEERERGETDSVVLRQLRAGLSRLDEQRRGLTLIAYEPVWAIGTGRTATPEDASAVHRVIRRELANLCGDAERARAMTILYGGSVNPANAKSLLSASDVDGLLVGGASLEASSWGAIASS
jgi:triosephosphate isomerase